MAAAVAAASALRLLAPQRTLDLFFHSLNSTESGISFKVSACIHPLAVLLPCVIAVLKTLSASFSFILSFPPLVMSPVHPVQMCV